MMKRRVTRRAFLRNVGVGASATLLASSGMSPVLAAAARVLASDVALQTVPVSLSELGPQVEVIVGDVLGFSLTSDDWEGAFGWVTLQCYHALYNGESVYHIRTDTSDQAFAQEQMLVWVPLLNAALAAEGATAKYYVFANGVEEQLPVVSSIPGQDDYSPAWHIHAVTFNGTPTLLDSAAAIAEAEAAGDITVQPTRIVVNYPIVKWTNDELPEDTERQTYLGTGPLIGPADTENMRVTFKLHQCFPGSRYIVTDTSAAPMAPVMHIAASPPIQALVNVGATDKIWVFGNGIPGSGVMGFQPAIFGHKAGEAIWSPFWNHFTIMWNDPSNAVVLTSAEEIQARLDAGDIQVFNGTPDTHPDGFVVNCPSPVLARNTFGA